jgi:hypothetical protein
MGRHCLNAMKLRVKGRVSVEFDDSATGVEDFFISRLRRLVLIESCMHL